MSWRDFVWLSILLVSCSSLADVTTGQLALAPTLMLPRQALDASELAVIINDMDPISVQVGEYYRGKRGIPRANLIHVRFTPGQPDMDPESFKKVYQVIQQKTPESVQAYAAAWTEPYRVGCMSLTSALTFGYDESFCASGCQLTHKSPYFASESVHPYSDDGIRPSMALAGSSLAAIKSLIDRGLESDGTHPRGTAYLVSTDDKARNVRVGRYPVVSELVGNAIRVKELDAPYIADQKDVLFYFIGSRWVSRIETNHFLPGAVADHLTSTGGQLTRSRQMSSLKWLDAGATGSFGAVVEPCNFPAKFPDPAILISRYLSGSTLIEAYWKSVLMPGQGIFIGDPLARPYGGYEAHDSVNGWSLRIYGLKPGRYLLQSAMTPPGPYRAQRRFIKSTHQPIDLSLGPNAAGYYRVSRVE